MADFRKEYLQLSAEEEKDIALKFADELHNKGLLSEEEYQEAKKNIQEQYKEAEEDGKGIF